MNPLYIHQEIIHNLAAPKEVVPIIMSLTNPKSVLDIGCGIGTWLKIFEEHGVTDYLGVDGDYVDRSLLKIPNTHFIAVDLRKEWSLSRKFDLVISLEVAEHLPKESADQFVKTLTSHGEIIIFSAAIPGQGGQNHLNEQWPKYWQELFQKHGFHFHDCIRPKIWDCDNVNWWYRQNMFLVSREDSKENIMSVIHPENFNSKVEQMHQKISLMDSGDLGVRTALKTLFRSVIKKIQK